MTDDAQEGTGTWSPGGWNLQRRVKPAGRSWYRLNGSRRLIRQGDARHDPARVFRVDPSPLKATIGGGTGRCRSGLVPIPKRKVRWTDGQPASRPGLSSPLLPELPAASSRISTGLSLNHQPDVAIDFHLPPTRPVSALDRAAKKNSMWEILHVSPRLSKNKKSRQARPKRPQPELQPATGSRNPQPAHKLPNTRIDAILLFRRPLRWAGSKCTWTDAEGRRGEGSGNGG